MVAHVEEGGIHQHAPSSPPPPSSTTPGLDRVEKTKTLICALNLLSRNLPLPPHVLDSVSSIYNGGGGEDRDGGGVGSGNDAADAGGDPSCSSACSGSSSDDRCTESAKKEISGVSSYRDLIMEFEDSVVMQRPTCMLAGVLSEIKKSRLQSQIDNRLKELEELPSSRGEDLQSKCLLELYGLKLGELQRKVRADVSAEYWLRLSCAYADKQLYDCGMARLPRPMYGVGDPFAVEADDQLRKKRDNERLSRLEEEEKNYVETMKRKFFADLLNAAREFVLQLGTVAKRRKQRNDAILAWHGRQRQRATRLEKLRFQALKSDDQEAYMKLVEESKNERLTMLLGKTNDLLVSLGAAVQRQKDAEHADGAEPLKDSEDSELQTPGNSNPDEVDPSKNDSKAGNLLEGQRKYNSAVHSIQEKVTEQPASLQGGELRQYQLEGLQWILSLFNNNLNGILADEMGLGKTIQTIALIAYLIENKGVNEPFLILGPKGVLPNWVTEFATLVFLALL